MKYGTVTPYLSVAADLLTSHNYVVDRLELGLNAEDIEGVDDTLTE
jgi:hypothetical protein